MYTNYSLIDMDAPSSSAQKINRDLLIADICLRTHDERIAEDIVDDLVETGRLQFLRKVLWKKRRKHSST
jgi:hypothetical protein